MVGCVLSQLNHRSFTFFDVEKAQASAFSTAGNVELFGLYPIHSVTWLQTTVHESVSTSHNDQVFCNQRSKI